MDKVGYRGLLSEESSDISLPFTVNLDRGRDVPEQLNWAPAHFVSLEAIILTEYRKCPFVLSRDH